MFIFQNSISIWDVRSFDKPVSFRIMFLEDLLVLSYNLLWSSIP